MTPSERSKFIEDVAEAIQANAPVLSEEEQRWVRLAIQKEAQSIKFREAVIEKTFTGLVWLIILGIGVLIKDFAISHGFK